MHCQEINLPLNRKSKIDNTHTTNNSTESMKNGNLNSPLQPKIMTVKFNNSKRKSNITRGNALKTNKKPINSKKKSS